MKHQGKFSPPTKVCELLRKQTSSKCKWTLNNTYQNIHDKTKDFIKNNATVAFYNEKEQQYWERDVSSAGLGTSLLQMRDGMVFPRDEAPNSAVLWLIVVIASKKFNKHGNLQ